MAVLHKPHGCLAFVCLSLLGDRVDGDGLLQNGISTVFLVFQHSDNHGFTEGQLLSGYDNLLSLKDFGDFIG